jgi:hypothetical protein
MHVNRDHPPPIINAGADVGGSQPFLDCGDGGVLVEGGGGAPCHTEVATEVRALGSRSGEASRARAPESPVPKAVLYGAMGVRIGADCIAYETLARRGELVALEVRDIDCTVRPLMRARGENSW